MITLEGDWAKGCCSLWLVGAGLALGGLALLWRRDARARQTITPRKDDRYGDHGAMQ